MKNLKQKSNFTFDFVIRSFIVDWWWVILFLFVSFFTYEQIKKDIHHEYLALNNRLSQLQVQKEKALETQAELKSYIHSQTDPEWIKLTLKKRLGVVPEGEVKVHFKGQS